MNSSPLISLSKDHTLIIKGVALILLLIHHLFYDDPSLYADINIAGYGLVHLTGIHCKICVAIFVFLSGYGLAASTPKGNFSLSSFFKRRFTKLFTNFWLIWLIFAPIGFLFFDYTLVSVYGEYHPLAKMILQFFGLQNIFGFHGLNATWWFMTCIILLYLLFPLLNKLSNKGLLAAAFAALILEQVTLPFVNDIYAPIRLYLLTFIAGMCGARSWQFTPPQWAKSQLLRLGILLMALTQRAFGIIRVPVDCDVVISIALAVLLKKWSALPYFPLSTLKFIGVHSMNIFLFHTFIYAYYWPEIIYATRNPVIIFLSLLGICLCISVLLTSLKSRLTGALSYISKAYMVK